MSNTLGSFFWVCISEAKQEDHDIEDQDKNQEKITVSHRVQYKACLMWSYENLKEANKINSSIFKSSCF